ncbi:hypothetical protein [Streptomyces sp. NPDC059744]|uniref:hypothetical protein n=1 Tax=Streptomyces sp. NPDC059744 TaxID=3346929 RepID=UPI00365BEB10
MAETILHVLGLSPDEVLTTPGGPPSGARAQPRTWSSPKAALMQEGWMNAWDAGKSLADVVDLLGSAATFSFVSERCASPPKR